MSSHCRGETVRGDFDSNFEKYRSIFGFFGAFVNHDDLKICFGVEIIFDIIEIAEIIRNQIAASFHRTWILLLGKNPQKSMRKKQKKRTKLEERARNVL